MRQIGILCAAALIAIKDNVPKLATDHHNAKLLASNIICSSSFFSIIYLSLFSYISSRLLGLILYRWIEPNQRSEGGSKISWNKHCEYLSIKLVWYHATLLSSNIFKIGLNWFVWYDIRYSLRWKKIAKFQWKHCVKAWKNVGFLWC